MCGLRQQNDLTPPPASLPAGPLKPPPSRPGTQGPSPGLLAQSPSKNRGSSYLSTTRPADVIFIVFSGPAMKYFRDQQVKNKPSSAMYSTDPSAVLLVVDSLASRLPVAGRVWGPRAAFWVGSAPFRVWHPQAWGAALQEETRAGWKLGTQEGGLWGSPRAVPYSGAPLMRGFRYPQTR